MPNGMFDSSSDTVAAVTGTNTAGGFGVSGVSNTNHAVHGESSAGRGVVGISQTFVGVTGESTSNDGVFGISKSGIGVHGEGGQFAGFFEGDVTITGKLNHGGVDALQQINSLKEQLSSLQTQVNIINGFGNLIQALANFDQQLQARITVLERNVNDLAAAQAAQNGSKS